MTSISTAFIPVSDPRRSADWYAAALNLRVHDITNSAAVLRGDGNASVTLMGPESGIAQAPGIAWATCNFAVADLPALRGEFARAGLTVTDIVGDPDRVLFFTTVDPDGNTLLITDR